MSKRSALRDLVMERLVSAADEIFTLIQEAFVEHETEVLNWAKLQQRKGVQNPIVPPEHTQESTALCNSLDLSFSPLKSNDNTDVPPFLQYKTAEGNKSEIIVEEAGCRRLVSNLVHDEKPDSCSDTDDSEDWETSGQNKNDKGSNNSLSCKRRKHRKRQHELIETQSGMSIKREREEELESYDESGAVCGTSNKEVRNPISEESLRPVDGLKSAQGKNKPAICPECGVTLRREYSLERHISAVHRGEKPYSCPVCERAFAQKADCVIHMSTHTGERPYVCPVCQRGFGMKKSLQRHMKRHRSR